MRRRRCVGYRWFVRHSRHPCGPALRAAICAPARRSCKVGPWIRLFISNMDGALRSGLRPSVAQAGRRPNRSERAAAALQQREKRQAERRAPRRPTRPAPASPHQLVKGLPSSLWNRQPRQQGSAAAPRATRSHPVVGPAPGAQRHGRRRDLRERARRHGARRPVRLLRAPAGDLLQRQDDQGV